MKKLLIASTNVGKIREFKELFQSKWPTIDIVGLDSLLGPPTVEETGATFLENALIKSKAYAAFSTLPTLSDDSGLLIDILNGEPGIFSARYAGIGATDGQNCAKVLRNLEGVPYEQRVARFTCALSLSFPEQTHISAEANMHGYIHTRPQGNHGFGYDPIFWLPQFQKTLAELTPSEKNAISHRRKALENLLQKIIESA